jgi:hypothetical protein
MLLWKKWLYGLAAAVIGGGAASISAGFGTILADPAKFNFHGGGGNLFEVMGITFVVSGLLHAAGYLAQSPLPSIITTVTTTTTDTVTKEKTG